MALPVLGVAARLLLSKGAREAIKRYGRAAVDKAKTEIAKRDRAISQRSREKLREEGINPSITRQQTDVGRKAGELSTGRSRQTRFDRQRAGRDFPQIKEEVPLKFSKGGKIDGKAIKGLTKGSRRK